MTGPNFFLVGAAKSGTTTLYEALRAHPDVYLPSVKEPHFYAYLAEPSTAAHLYPDRVTARERYLRLYDGAAGERAVGDASTTNLVVAGGAAAIARDVPDARIVAILRQPVDRAFSHFCHMATTGGEDIDDFAEAVAAEPGRRRNGLPFNYQYLEWSRYSDQLRPYVERFGRDRVLVHLYEDLCQDGETVVRTTFRHLGVDDTEPVPPLSRHNEVRAAPDNGGRLRRLLGRDPAPSRPRPRLDPDLRARLTTSLAGEIDRLEVLLGRNLDPWRA